MNLQDWSSAAGRAPLCSGQCVQTWTVLPPQSASDAAPKANLHKWRTWKKTHTFCLFFFPIMERERFSFPCTRSSTWHCWGGSVWRGTVWAAPSWGRGWPEVLLRTPQRRCGLDTACSEGAGRISARCLTAQTQTQTQGKSNSNLMMHNVDALSCCRIQHCLNKFKFNFNIFLQTYKYTQPRFVNLMCNSNIWFCSISCLTK